MKFPVAYAAVNQNAAVRANSSSGGVFYLLAEYVISRGGVVFGARYNADWEVVHGYAESMDDAAAFMGSKYVQSRIGDAYTQARDFLKQGRLVLFSGTTCQIYGLKAFLGKHYNNLITVDLICHGVPSPKVWREYLQLRSGNRGIKSISFRDKTQGWLVFSLKIDFENGETHRKTLKEDLFMRGFLQDIYLRPSCYQCRFRGEHRNTDITLADLWGCKTIAPDMFDDKGVSLVLVQSETGADIWQAACSAMEIRELKTKEYQQFNKSLKTSVAQPGKRRKFWQDPSFENLEKLVLKKDSLPERVLRKAKKAIKQLLKRV